jgi:UDP-N-acetylglucosamine:LPS N-acetylglucosamine transferase
MQVVGYLHHDDFLLEDEQHVMVMGGGGYVLSCGDQVTVHECIDAQKNRYVVRICFANTAQEVLHEDQMTLKFSGDRANFQQYIKASTVH